MSFCKLYGQDTLIPLPSSLIRALYIDAIQKDSCQKRYTLLAQKSQKQAAQLRFSDSLHHYQNQAFATCEAERATTLQERNDLAEQKKALDLQLARKNKWLSRLLIACGIEALAIVLLL